MGYVVISRRVGERIFIGEDIEILISDIRSDRAKVDIAVKAPRDYDIKRKSTHIEEQDFGANARHKPR